MGRNALGAAAKDQVVGVRMTRSEREALEAAHGNVGKWLRRLVDEELSKELAK